MSKEPFVSHCGKHPQYRGKRQPRSMCPACWQVWFYSPFNDASKSVVPIITLLNQRDLVAMKDKACPSAHPI